MRPLTEEERRRFVDEAMTWVGTPFVNCGDVKGPKGCVDCAMLLVRCTVDTGLLPPFDPRPYPPQWHMHHDEERFLKWLQDELHGVETWEPRAGDVAVFKFGRCFSHGAVMTGPQSLVHAYFRAGCVLPALLKENDLRYMGAEPRPVRFFQLRTPLE